MSKYASLKCKIENVDPNVLKKALEHLIRLKDGSLRLMDIGRYYVYCNDLGSFDVEVMDNKIKVGCDEIMVKRATEVIEQFYIATELEEEFNSSFELDKNGDLVLMVEV